MKMAKCWLFFGEIFWKVSIVIIPLTAKFPKPHLGFSHLTWFWLAHMCVDERRVRHRGMLNAQRRRRRRHHPFKQQKISICFVQIDTATEYINALVRLMCVGGHWKKYATQFFCFSSQKPARSKFDFWLNYFLIVQPRPQIFYFHSFKQYFKEKNCRL